MPLPSDIVRALVKAIEMKDLSTAAHTWRVVLYTRALTEALGLSHEVVERASAAAALHDVGKVDIPDAILQKPGKLTDEEFAIIKTHPAIGHERLVSMGEDDPLVLELVRHHHEREDGKGYPDGVSGAQLPMAARYFSVVDTFDALTSVRPYRREIGPEAAEHAVRELEAGIGSRYNEDCVRAFVELYRQGELGWILDYYNDRAELETFGGAGHAAAAVQGKKKKS